MTMISKKPKKKTEAAHSCLCAKHEPIVCTQYQGAKRQCASGVEACARTRSRSALPAEKARIWKINGCKELVKCSSIYSSSLIVYHFFFIGWSKDTTTNRHIFYNSRSAWLSQDSERNFQYESCLWFVSCVRPNSSADHRKIALLPMQFLLHSLSLRPRG
jgi:hypothetical protein